jgi:hypothetical protein
MLFSIGVIFECRLDSGKKIVIAKITPKTK